MQAAPKVFIVDDHEAVRNSIRVLLESHGCQLMFSDTADFTRDYELGPNQCLLLDQHRPQLTGLALLASSEGAAIRLKPGDDETYV